MSGRTRRGRSRWLWGSLLVTAIAGMAVVAALLMRPSEDPNRLRERAIDAVKGGRYQEAEGLLKRIRPMRSLDWIMRSKVDQSLGRPRAALEALAKVPDDDRMGSLARFSEGTILLHDLHLAVAAEAALRRAIELDPRSVQSRQKLMLLAYALSLKPEFQAQFRALERLGKLTFEDVQHACVVIREGWETRQIVAMLRGFLDADPADQRSRLALAAELRRMNRRDEAAKVIEVLPRSDTRAEAIRAGLALDRSDLNEARAILDAGPAEDPDLAPLRGRLALARRDAAAAVKQYRIAVAAQPDHRDSLAGLGRALRMAGDAKAAEPYLKTVANLDALELLMQNLLAPGASNDPSLLHKLGAACEALRRFPEARTWYRLSLMYDPKSDSTRQALATIENTETP